MLKITILHSDITQITADAIVNPANSYGYMGGGVAGALKKFGGIEIEQEAAEQAPIPIGHAVLTRAGLLKCRQIIHAPTMHQPAEPTTSGNVREATRAALQLADDEGFEKIAMPGMGTGVGKLGKLEAAKAMFAEILNFEPQHLKEIVLIDHGKEMVQAWKKLWGEK